MTRSQKITIGLILAAGLVLIGWDVVVMLNDRPNDTISELLLYVSYTWWCLPFCFGALTTHLFVPRATPLFRLPLRPGAVIALLFPSVFVINAIQVWLYGPTTVNALALVVGGAVGWAVWPNRWQDGQ